MADWIGPKSIKPAPIFRRRVLWDVLRCYCTAAMTKDEESRAKGGDTGGVIRPTDGFSRQPA
jgi:hypothetical protein